MTYTNFSARDSRCAYCGRPALGPFVQGHEGIYHPECVRSPFAAPPLPVVPVMPELPPYTIAPLTFGDEVAPLTFEGPQCAAMRDPA